MFTSGATGPAKGVAFGLIGLLSRALFVLTRWQRLLPRLQAWARRRLERAAGPLDTEPFHADELVTRVERFMPTATVATLSAGAKNQHSHRAIAAGASDGVVGSASW